MPIQPTLQQLFANNKRVAGTSGLNLPSYSAAASDQAECTDSAAAAAVKDSGKHGPEKMKENQPAAQIAAAGVPSKSSSRAKQHVRAGGPHTGNISSQQQPKSTQLYLDLGQRDFGASRCSVCGMLYTKGLEEDEKLHKAYHQGAVQGLKFQGWPQERVLLSEVGQGRLLMVLQTDPANHVKKVQELCTFLENTHGMAPGWLLSAPQARVFLYVSSQKRVLGLAVVEPLRHAYRVMAPAGSQEQEVESVAPISQPQQQQQQQRQKQQQARRSILVAAASVQQQQQQQKREPQQLLWPGLRKRGRLAALGRAAGSGGNILLSDPSLHSVPGGPSCNVRADSCPTSLLAGAGRLQLMTESSGNLPSSSAAVAATATASAAETVTLVCNQVAAVGDGAQEVAMLTLSQPGMAQPQSAQQQVQEMQQQQLLQQQPVDSPAQAMQPPRGQPAQQLRVPPWQRDAAASRRTDSAPATSGSPVSDSAANGPGRAGSSMRRVNPQIGAALGGSSSGGRSLLVDQRKAVRAMLGVRMVWVSPEQRRGGVATKLLDAGRCNMVPGYVAPCNQVAFSQPTGDGAALAAAFAGTQQFLVYGFE